MSQDTTEVREEAMRSQEAGVPAPEPEPETPAEDLRPFMLAGQVIASVHNGDGEIVGTRAVANIEIFRPNFEKLPEVAEETVSTYVETEAQMQQAASEKSG